MEREINISIKDKIAVADKSALYICGNSDFVINFAFDEEWESHITKTARFIFNDRFIDVVFEGNQCAMPVISNTYNIQVGVFAGNLHTSTPAHISAKKSILCGTNPPADPTPDVYAQMVELFNAGLDESRINANEAVEAKEAAAESAELAEAAAEEAKKIVGNTTTQDGAMFFTDVSVQLPVVAGAVAYGDGKYVATPYDSNKGAYSTDGITWTETTFPSSGRWSSVTYGDGRFVAVSDGTKQGAYSTDGIVWTEMGFPYNAKSVAYGDGKLVVVGGGNRVSCSTDGGITWESVVINQFLQFHSVTYGDGKFLAASGTSKNVAYSSDGINWKGKASPYNFSFVTYGKDKFIGVGKVADALAYSADGIEWTAIDSNSEVFWASVAYGGGKFVAVPDAHDDEIKTYDTNKAIYSTDGITWTETVLPCVGKWLSVAYGGDKFVAVGKHSDNLVVAISYDGINWYSSYTPEHKHTIADVDGLQSALDEVRNALNEIKTYLETM